MNPLDHYLNADDYVRQAGLRMSGRTLQRRCNENPFLAQAIGELKWSARRTYYDGRTAKSFRKLFLAAEIEFRRWKNESEPRL